MNRFVSKVNRIGIIMYSKCTQNYRIIMSNIVTWSIVPLKEYGINTKYDEELSIEHITIDEETTRYWLKMFCNEKMCYGVENLSAD